MSNHPLNLGLRFILELAGLFAMGYWGWTQHEGLTRFVWTLGLPLGAALIWGIFRVPGDPSDAPVAVPGIIRLVYEIMYFFVAVWALNASQRQNWGLILAMVTIFHYLLSYDRISWLIKR
jgi:hypothetical protein